MARKPNYASLYTLRADGRYQGSYTDATGRHYVYDRDPERLWHKLNDPKEEKPILFEDIAHAWHDAAYETMKDGTAACYTAHYNRALERLHGHRADAITAHDIQSHLLIMKAQGRAASTIRKQKIVYSLIFQYAISDRLYGETIKFNPAANAQLPPGMPRAKKRQAPEDQIVKDIQAHATTAYFGMFAMFLICTGFRRGEALAVKWQDVDFKNRTISCSASINFRTGAPKETTTKTVSGVRTVPLINPLERVLIMPESAKPGDYIFPGEDPSKPMPKKTYDRKWLHYCKDMGYIVDEPEKVKGKNKRTYVKHHYKPTLTAHELRHGYATILFEAGVDTYTAQRLLGHADIETTIAIYTHLREKKQNESIEKLLKHTIETI